MEFTFQCQDASQKCENLYGSYKCVCGEGLYWIDNKCQGLFWLVSQMEMTPRREHMYWLFQLKLKKPFFTFWIIWGKIKLESVPSSLKALQMLKELFATGLL